jgi:hypothetical protein
MARRFRPLSWALFGALGVAAPPGKAESNRAELEIVGTLRARVELEAVRAEGSREKFRIHGRVEDELGRPIGGARVFLPGARSERCSDGRPEAETASDGTFCLKPEDQALPSRLRAEANGFEGIDVPLEPEAVRARLEIVYAPHVIDLGADDQGSITVRHAATNPTELELIARYGKESTSLGRTPPGPSGQTDLRLSSRQLHQPGSFELVVRQGDMASEPWPVLARAKIDLKLIQVTTENRIVRVFVAAQAGAVLAKNGRVEVMLSAGQRLASLVKDGRAALEIPRSQKDELVNIAYVPLAPEYLAGASVKLNIAAQASTSPNWLVHAALLSAFLFWFTRRWLRRPRPSLLEPDDAESVVVEAKPKMARGISGRVVDAHTGEGQSRATVKLIQVQAVGEAVLGTTTTDEAGRFAIPVQADQVGPFAVEIDQPGYRPLRWPIGLGQLRIQIVERRRAALMDLLRWARRAGSPWTLARAPTPLEVAALSHAQGHGERGVWAEQVNVDAFGPLPPEGPLRPDWAEPSDGSNKAHGSSPSDEAAPKVHRETQEVR